MQWNGMQRDIGLWNQMSISIEDGGQRIGMGIRNKKQGIEMEGVMELES